MSDDFDREEQAFRDAFVQELEGEGFRPLDPDQLKAAAPRCVTLSVGVEMDLGGWTWHDVVQTRRVMEPQGDYFANVSSLPFGRRGEQSPYLFGVVSSGRVPLRTCA